VIAYDVIEFRRLGLRMRAELLFKPFFRALDLGPEQKDYFLRRGIDNGLGLSDFTQRMRRDRIGHYKKAPKHGARPSGPRMVWTGNTLAHTYHKKGLVSIQARAMKISHTLDRLVTNYWDTKALDNYIDGILDRWFQNALKLKRNPRRTRARVGG